jgi:SulP family sulfate permease
MSNLTTRTAGAAVNTLAASALESRKAITGRLKDGGIALHLSEVKGPVMSRLKRSHFLKELTGKVTQFDVVSSIKPQLTRRTVEARRQLETINAQPTETRS